MKPCYMCGEMFCQSKLCEMFRRAWHILGGWNWNIEKQFREWYNGGNDNKKEPH